MKTKILYLLLSFIMLVIAFSCNQTLQQEEKKLPASTYKMTTVIPEGIAIPDRLDSRLGPLTFFDGFPDG